MSIYFIRTSSGVTYELDSTSDITYKLTGKATDNPVESGDSVSDNYVNKPRMITLKGTVSDVKGASLSFSPVTKSTDDFIRGLEKVKVNKELFTLHFGNKVGIITNCLFESLTFKQNKKRGSMSTLDAFEVSMTIKQIRLASRALLVPTRDPSIVNDASSKTKGSGSPEEPDEEDTSLMAITAKLAKFAATGN